MRYFEIGKIVNTQGIKGDLRVVPMTDDIKRFEMLKEVLVETKSGPKPFAIERIRYHKNFLILKLKGIDTMTEAETFKNRLIKIEEKNALPLEAGEYYIRDIIGLFVHAEDGEEIGEITDIIRTGANDVYVANDKKSKSGQLLIPATKEFVTDINIEKGTMTVRIIDGLRDLK